MDMAESSHRQQQSRNMFGWYRTEEPLWPLVLFARAVGSEAKIRHMVGNTKGHAKIAIYDSAKSEFFPA